MKKMMMILAMMVAIATSAGAMSYKEAKRQALFLADKMAYELNLTDEQYEAAYEINLDYLMAVNHRDHLFGAYWSNRNALFRVVLAPWQYNAYIRADYFYRPVYWSGNTWRWHIYSHYGRTRFYRNRPVAYISYRGGRPAHYYHRHNWHHPKQRSNHRRDDVYMGSRSHTRSHHQRYDHRPRIERHDKHNKRHFDHRRDSRHDRLYLDNYRNRNERNHRFDHRR